MKYWDASALVPLLVSEATTPVVRQWLEDDPLIVTWVWSAVEITSAVERRFREGRLNQADRRDVLARLSLLAGQWDEITDILVVRRQANRLLARYPLRAAGAGQLAAALVLFEDQPEGQGFVCLDQRLGYAAEMEGFSLFTI
ncbi:MAG: type II toxin-antitoxin system VapC family toxin [Wenzhouxiangella sp.]